MAKEGMRAWFRVNLSINPPPTQPCKKIPRSTYVSLTPETLQHLWRQHGSVVIL